MISMHGNISTDFCFSNKYNEGQQRFQKAEKPFPASSKVIAISETFDRTTKLYT